MNFDPLYQESDERNHQFVLQPKYIQIYENYIL